MRYKKKIEMTCDNSIQKIHYIKNNKICVPTRHQLV